MFIFYFLFAFTVYVSYSVALDIDEEAITAVQPDAFPHVSLSYRQTHICETTPGVKSYSGYIRIPPGDSSSAPSNFFFWFFESRNDPLNDPFTIWLSGGPGSSSIASAVSENGPCWANRDGNSTTLNPWSWNNVSNILYIDQPVLTGYSYDVLTNATLNMLTTEISPSNFSKGIPKTNDTFYVGRFGSQSLSGTVNSTENGAHVLWTATQVWLQEFPAYRPKDNNIHLWTESFGGKYGPTYVDYFQKQVDNIRKGPTTGVIPLHIKQLGIINGCSDVVVQGMSYPQMMYNNTYGLKIIDGQTYEEVMNNLTKPDGCLDLTYKCRRLAGQLDPENRGNNSQVNQACQIASLYCYNNVLGVYGLSQRSQYDISQIPTSTWPPSYLDAFFNSECVMKDLGVPVNFTHNSLAVYNAFASTGDALIIREGTMEMFSSILARGTKLDFVYGDRDFLCNWIGGENLSLAINHSAAPRFAAAGYENLTTSVSRIGGVVRQHGNLSFSRVFEAGHEVPAYQPETAYTIFKRSIEEMDIATGTVSLSNPQKSSNYSTAGPLSSWSIKDALPPPPPIQCYLWEAPPTCTVNQQLALESGTAVIDSDYIIAWPLE